MSKEVSKALLINTFWSIGGRFGYLIIGLMTNIFLSRLLTPKEFGQVAIMMFFVVISTVLIESGLSGALIRKKNVSEDDYSTVFIFNLIISSLIALILIGISPYVAEYYKDPQLEEIIKWSTLALFINALGIVQTTKLIREMRFKVKALCEFVAIFLGSVISISLALRGFGVWALVILQISMATVLNILLWCVVGPLKNYNFSFQSFGGIYKFGANTTLALILSTVFDNIYQLIIGKYFTLNQVGFFYQAKRLQEIPVGIVQGSVLNVIYSSLSKIQDNHLKFSDFYNNIIKYFSIIMAFICLTIFFYSDLIIIFLFGEKWIESAIYLRLLILASFFYMQELFCRLIFKVYDKTEKILQLEIIKKIFQSFTIFYALYYEDVKLLLYGFILTNIFGFILNFYFCNKVQNKIGYNILFVILKILVISTIIFMVFKFIGNFFGISIVKSLSLLPIMLIVYFWCLNILRVIEIKYEIKKIKSYLVRKN